MSFIVSPDPSIIAKKIAEGKDNLYLAKFSEEISVAFELPPYSQVMRLYNLVNNVDSHNELCDLYETIFSTYVLDKSILCRNKIPAGIPESVVKLIFHLSTLQNSDTAIDYTNNLLDTLREKCNDPVSAMKRVICTIFSGYTFSILNKLDMNELVTVYVNAEKVALEKGIIEEGLKIISKNTKNDNSQSFDDIVSTSNRELENLDRGNQKMSMKDIQEWKQRKLEMAKRFK